MKFLFDYFPIVLFVAFYILYDIYVATAVTIAAAFIQNALYWYRHRGFEKLHVITLATVVVLGGATLIFHNKAFIMWKPTAVYWAFAIAIIGSQFIGKKPIVQRMMAHAIDVPNPIWRNANILMGIFCIFLGFANLYVASFYFDAENLLFAATNKSVEVENCAEQFQGEILELCNNAKTLEQRWAFFKLFGMLGLSILFMFGLALYLARHMKQEPESPKQTEQENEA